jgi:glyoxylase-like metal-dependent hydrolase (beta-lactamase superfamily II)
MLQKKKFILKFVSVLILIHTFAFAQNKEIEIKPVKMSENVYMLIGSGGNLGVSIGEDGTFLIDDQFAALNEKIMAAIKSIGGGEVKFLLNTHFHGDHTGGNELIGESGSVIVAHENVRTRLSKDMMVPYFKVNLPALKKPGLPVITFTSNLTFHFNNDEIEFFHVGPAHTDGDGVVYFKKENVLHAGDIFFESMYPFVDMHNGGNVVGLVKAIDDILEKINPDTKIISGHGNFGTYDQFNAYGKVMATIVERVKAMHSEGKTLEEIKAAKPTAEFDEEYNDGIVPAEDFVMFVYESLEK